jgi:hypothetical protein
MVSEAEELDKLEIIKFFFDLLNSPKDCDEFWSVLCNERGIHNLFNHLESESHSKQLKQAWNLEKQNRLLQNSGRGKSLLDRQ